MCANAIPRFLLSVHFVNGFRSTQRCPNMHMCMYVCVFVVNTHSRTQRFYNLVARAALSNRRSKDTSTDKTTDWDRVVRTSVGVG